jgi:hypothetical protein
VVAPLGLISLLVALGAAMFNPQFVKQSLYITVICAVMFVIMANASDLMDAVSRN